MQRDALAWLQRTANAKLHGTTKRIPAREWEIEKQHLLPYSGIPEKPFLQLPAHPVRKDNTILYRSNFYSVPLNTYQGADTKILLDEKDGKLYFYTPDNQLLTTHNLSLDTGRIIKNNDHMREKSKTLLKTYELVLHELGNTSQAEQYLTDLEKDKPRHFHDNLRVIQKNIEKQPQELIEAALSFCIDNRILNGNQFREILTYYRNQQQEYVKPNINIEPGNIGNVSTQDMTPKTSNINEYESIM